jgi:peptidoglycan DL-endopeptidase CwlO
MVSASSSGVRGYARGNSGLSSFVLTGAVLFAFTALCGAVLLWASPAPATAVPNEQEPVRLYGNTKTQVDNLTVQAGYVQADIDSLDEELEQCSETYNQLQVRLDEVNIQMASLRRDYQATQSDHTYRVQRAEDRLCDLYKSGGHDQFLELLLESDGLEDLVNRIRLIATIADQDQRIVDNLTKSTDKLNTLLAQIDETKAEQLSLRREMGDQRERIAATLKERETTLANIDEEISTIIEAERKRQEQEQAQLREALRAMLNGGEIYSGPLPETDSEILSQFLQTAAYYIGIPYVWAGDRPSTGFDCSGFTQYVYAQHGIYLPHYSGYQAEMGIPVALEDIQPGDLVAFGFPVHHVGIYIGDGMFIHAPRTGDVVSIWYLNQKTNLSAIRRFDLQPRIGAPAVD